MEAINFEQLPSVVLELQKEVSNFKSLMTNVIEASKKEEELLTVQETADFFKISKPTLYRWINEGAITVYGVSGSRFFKKSELIESLTALKNQRNE